MPLSQHSKTLSLQKSPCICVREYEQAVEGFEVPWTSNPVERLMGEVSNRCKNQWRRWTADGLEALLNLRLVKYTDPAHYQSFFDDLLQRSIKTAMSCDLSTESTRGKL